MSDQHEHHEHHHQKDSGTVEISKSTLWMIVSGILGLLLVVSIFTSGFGIVKDAAPSGYAPSPSPSPSPSPAPSGLPTGIATVNAKELADDDPYLGNKDAKVVMIEFSDYQCPFCARFEEGAYVDIKKNYIDTGKVKFVYRDFPLSFHENAQKAAEASECADEQGKFWEMHDLMFKNQQSIAVTDLKKYAVDLKLDTKKFNDCLDTGKYAQETQKDEQDGQRAGISGTPGFIINGKLVSGAMPFANFKSVIDAELNA